MKTRITITLDAELLQAAKAVAVEEGRPLSALLTDQLAAIVCERKGFAQARERALARLREGIDLSWTPARSRHDVQSGRPSVSALVLQTVEELGDTLDRNPSKAAKAQKVGVAADDHLGFCSDGALKNPVVRRVSLDRVDALGRLDQPGDDTQLSVGFSNPLGRVVELVLEDAKRLRDDGFGDSKVDGRRFDRAWHDAIKWWAMLPQPEVR